MTTAFLFIATFHLFSSIPHHHVFFMPSTFAVLTAPCPDTYLSYANMELQQAQMQTAALLESAEKGAAGAKVEEVAAGGI
jgi:hypothetical protein